MEFTPSRRLQSRIMTGPSQHNVASTLPVPVFVQLKRRRRLKQFARCSFAGFYEPESLGDRRHIWTQEKATVECHFIEPSQLQYVWLEIAATAPEGGTVQVWIDDECVVPLRRVKGKTTVRGRLTEARVFHELKLTIQTSTFVPSAVGIAADDGRHLGIAVRGIVFGKRRHKYQQGSLFSRPLRRRLESAVQRLVRRRHAA